MASPPGPRRRDSAASRDRLLRAARELFGERGYDRTTARDIGKLARVDPTMIARYFGGKAQLYLEVISSLPDHSPASLLDADRLTGLIEDAAEHGISPVYHTVAQPFEDRALQDAAVSELHKRLVAPLRARLESDGTASPDLRAQVLTAAFAGIMEARASNALPAVKAASVPELAAVVRHMLAAAAASKDPGSRQEADGDVTG